MKKEKQRHTPTLSLTGKGVFPPAYAFTLLIPLRNIFLSPRQLVSRLKLTEEMHVLELGPGPGYFSPAIARRLSRGKLVLADIQQEMLDLAQKRMTRKKLSNVDFYRCNGETFGFEDNHFDRIFMVTVLGEVAQKEAYMKECYRMLKPGGILSITELAGDPDKLPPGTVTALAEAEGFSRHEKFGNKRNYTLNFRK